MLNSKLILPITCLLLVFSSCDSSTKNSHLKHIEYTPATEGFDWENDPLKITYTEDFSSPLSSDTVDIISNHLYSYFHNMNIADSASMDKYIAYFPDYMRDDTASMNFYREATIRWKKNGLLQTVEFCELDYISDWKRHFDLQIAHVSCDVEFFQHFQPHYEGSPEGMRFTLTQRFGSDAVKYTEEYRQNSSGDSVLVRNWKAHAESGVFVLYDETDKEQPFRLLLQDVVEVGGPHRDNIPMATLLSLLRDERERVK